MGSFGLNQVFGWVQTPATVTLSPDTALASPVHVLNSIAKIFPSLLLIGWVVYFSYAVLRSGSVWPAVLLHGATNTLAPRLLSYFGNPIDPIFSIGLGLFGILILAIPAAYLFVTLPRSK